MIKDIATIITTLNLFDVTDEMAEMILDQIEDDSTNTIMRPEKRCPQIREVTDCPKNYNFFVDEAPEAMEMNDFMGADEIEGIEFPE